MKTALRLQLCLFVAMTFRRHLADAQTIKPGLWEITHKMGGNPKMDEAMAKMEKQMASMPAEQRKMMQEMLAKNGVAMGGPAVGGGTVVKVCISREMGRETALAESNPGRLHHHHHGQDSEQHENELRLQEPTLQWPRRLRLQWRQCLHHENENEPRRQGKQESMTMDASGKWLTGDCGSVKPVPMPAK